MTLDQRWYMHGLQLPLTSIKPNMKTVGVLIPENHHDEVHNVSLVHRHVVGLNSIATPARGTTSSRRVLLATCCLHSCQQSETNSGSNPPRIDRELLLLLGFSASFAVSVGCKSIEAPALQTTASWRAILAANCLHSFCQPEFKLWIQSDWY